MARTYLKLRRWFFAGRHRSADPAEVSRTSRFSGLSLTCSIAWFSVAVMHGAQGRRLTILYVAFGVLTWLLRVWGLRGGSAESIASNYSLTSLYAANAPECSPDLPNPTVWHAKQVSSVE